MPSFQSGEGCWVTDFGCPKTDFQSSKFHKISNLKNEKFDQNPLIYDQIMPKDRAFGVCLGFRIFRFPNHAQYGFGKFHAFDQKLGVNNGIYPKVFAYC